MYSPTGFLMKVSEIRLDEGFDLHFCPLDKNKGVASFALYCDPYWLQSTSIRMRLPTNGFSHGLKIARQLSIFAPVYTPVPPFRILSHPLPIKKTAKWRSFLLAEDEGFEPPQTESESGVLPLH